MPDATSAPQPERANASSATSGLAKWVTCRGLTMLHAVDPSVPDNKSYARALCAEHLLRPVEFTGDVRSRPRCKTCVRRASNGSEGER